MLFKESVVESVAALFQCVPESGNIGIGGFAADLGADAVFPCADIKKLIPDG